jgi:hypothetical protein
MVHAGIPSGCGPFAADPGGIAGAQPPANRCDASGIESFIFCGLGSAQYPQKCPIGGGCFTQRNPETIRRSSRYLVLDDPTGQIRRMPFFLAVGGGGRSGARELSSDTHARIVLPWQELKSNCRTNWGCDHRDTCFAALLEGAGIRGGNMCGKSDRGAAYPNERPVFPEDIAETLNWSLGVDTEMMLHGRQNRPVPFVESGRSLYDLFG